MTALGFVCLARTTFDTELAAQTAAKARAQLSRFANVTGGETLLTDAASATQAAKKVLSEGADALVIAQLTFADADAVCDIGGIADAPLVLWAFPEERTGGRLRLNSPCGINLAAHALGKRGRAFSHLYCAPDELTETQLQNAIDEASNGNANDTAPSFPRRRESRATRESEEIPACAGMTEKGAGMTRRGISGEAKTKARAVLDSLRGSLFARAGTPPDGFATCEFDSELLRNVFGAQVRDMTLQELFSAAEDVGDDEVKTLRESERAALANFDEMDANAADKTLRLRAALQKAAREEKWAGAAIRCWPEMFTEFGGACCGAMSALGGGGVPCACEADVNGAVSARILQELTNSPAFLADWVDCAPDGTAAFWHCGLAPLQMAGDAPRAAIHSNRKMPLLREFALKPGAATVARLTMARNRPHFAAARATVTGAPRPFGGTCGVLKFERPAREVFDAAVRAGMEHHYAVAYGDVFDECAAFAEAAGLPFMEL